MAISKVRIGDYGGWARGAAAQAGFQEVLAALAASFDPPGGGPTPSRLIRPLEWEGRTYFVKFYASLTLKARLQMFFRWSKADKARRSAERLRQVGIDTPRVLAQFKRWSGQRPPAHLLITEGVAGQTLRAALQAPMPLARHRALIRSLALFLARLHDAGIYHGDFSAFNIMAQYGEAGRPVWRIFLIDLDAVRSLRWISRRRQIKNLDELGRSFPRLKEVSTRDRLRFLCQYTGSRQGSRLALRPLKMRVCRRTALRMRSYGKRFIDS